MSEIKNISENIKFLKWLALTTTYLILISVNLAKILQFLITNDQVALTIFLFLKTIEVSKCFKIRGRKVLWKISAKKVRSCVDNHSFFCRLRPASPANGRTRETRSWLRYTLLSGFLLSSKQIFLQHMTWTIRSPFYYNIHNVIYSY